MLLRILGSDEEKERVIKILKEEKIAFDFPADIPLGTNPENLLLWSSSGKGESKIKGIDENGNLIVNSDGLKKEIKIGSNPITFSLKVSKEEYKKYIKNKKSK